jgi:hypothetical protein
MKFAHRDEVSPLPRVELGPEGELCPLGVMFTLSISPRDEQLNTI